MQSTLHTLPFNAYACRKKPPCALAACTGVCDCCAPERQPHGVEAQQLRAVHYGRKVANLRVCARPQAAHHCAAVVEAIPGEGLWEQVIRS